MEVINPVKPLIKSESVDLDRWVTRNTAQAMIDQAMADHESKVSRHGYLLFSVVIAIILLLFIALFVHDFRLVHYLQAT